MSSAQPIFFGGGLPDPRLRPDLAPLLAEVMAEDAEATSYGGTWGYEGLRAALAARMAARSGAALTPEHVVLTNGSAGALEAVARQYVAPGDLVVVEALTYPGAVETFRQRGARIVTVPLDGDGMDVDALGDLLRAGERPALVYTIATCQSPTATMLAAPRRQELVALAARYGFTVLQDDTYGELLYAPDRVPAPMIGLDAAYVVHVGSLSKTLAPGIRVGWVTAPPAACAAIAGRRTDLGNPPFVHRAVARLFERGGYEAQLDRILPTYRAKRDVVLRALDEHCAGLGTWQTPDGGFFVWFQLATGDVAELEPAASAAGVSWFGGPYFSAAERNGKGIRLAFGQLPESDLDEGVRRLAHAITHAAS